MADLVAIRLTAPDAVVAAVDQAWAAGDAVLPLDPTAPDVHVADTVARLRPAALVHERPDGRPRVSRLADGEPVADGTALVVATSGSTGTPKGVVLSHEALQASARASVDRLACAPGTRWLGCLPLHHVAGLQVVLRSRMLGTEPLLHAGFDRRAVAAAADEAGHVALVPTQLHRLLEAGLAVDRFATILLGGAAASADLLHRAAEAGARVVTSYGMTETCGGCVYDGLPLDGVEVRVTEQGRIRIRGPVLADGYRGTDAPVRGADGWFDTADRGHLDDAGRLVVLGRSDDVVVSGGVNVAVAEVAARLRSHPDVVEVAVTGRDHPSWGEEVVAVVVPRDPTAPPALGSLRDHVRAALPASHAPRDVMIVDALPRDGLGKVTRDVLTALVNVRT